MSRPSLLVLFGAALGLAACGKDPQPTTTPDGGGAASADDGSGGGASDDELSSDATDDLEPDPDSADDWDPQAGGGDEWAASENKGPVAVKKDPRADLTEPKEMASVTIEIKGSSGKVRKSGPQVIDWDQLTRIPIDFEGQIHEFEVRLAKDGGAKVGVTISYVVGGEEVMRDYGFDTKPKAREVLRIDNGTAVALTVIPKTVKPYTKKEREKLEGKAEKDPLAGARE